MAHHALIVVNNYVQNISHYSYSVIIDILAVIILHVKASCNYVTETNRQSSICLWVHTSPYRVRDAREVITTSDDTVSFELTKVGTLEVRSCPNVHRPS